jgi:hypothetical protein
MQADPQTLIAVVVALVGGLLAFAILLLAGVALVHALRLPQDLPDGPRFEPPPPPLRARGEVQGARQAAQRQAAVAALYAHARDLDLQERECQALAALAAPAGAPRPPPAVAVPAAQLQAAAEACAAAQGALRAFDQRLRGAPAADAGNDALAAELAACAPVVGEALAAARALAAAAPAAGPPRRRLLLLAAFLLLWLAALAVLLWR